LKKGKEVPERLWHDLPDLPPLLKREMGGKIRATNAGFLGGV